jgi:hypothetical protein
MGCQSSKDAHHIQRKPTLIIADDEGDGNKEHMLYAGPPRYEGSPSRCVEYYPGLAWHFAALSQVIVSPQIYIWVHEHQALNL